VPEPEYAATAAAVGDGTSYGSASTGYVGTAPQDHVAYAPPPQKRKKWPWVVGIIVVLIVILSQCGGSDDEVAAAPPSESVASAEPSSQPSVEEDAAEEPAAQEPAPAEEPEEAAEPAPAPEPVSGYGEFPADEAQFVSLVTTAQQAVQAAENDMQIAAAKATRDSGICSLLPARTVTGWTGKVVEVGANGEGKGILTVEVAPEVEIGTWNNFLSDALDETLIEPSSPVFTSAATLTEGQIVRFSGEFIGGSDPDCLRESSLTLRGGVEDPSFIFRFSEVSPG
jgi:hypothetical protein